MVPYDKRLEQSRTTLIINDKKLYDELTEFAHGEKPLSDFPAFEAEVCRLALVPVVEISVESKHALAAAKLRSTGHNVSHAGVSLALKGDEITAQSEANLESLVELAKEFSEIDNLDRFIRF